MIDMITQENAMDAWIIFLVRLSYSVIRCEVMFTGAYNYVGMV